MTNEALAELIGAGGNDELIPVLWEKVRKFYRMQADKYAAHYPEQCARYGVTAADLQQEGYLSMLEAVKAYSRKAPETDAAFITFCGLHYKNKCASLIGIRRGHTSDALNRCYISLNEPLENKDGDTDAERGDLIEDTEASAPFEEVERRDQSERVRAVCRTALKDERERRTIELYYFEGRTLKEIAAAEGLSIERIRAIKARAYRHLMNNRALRALASLDYYQHISVTACQRAGSAVERIAERRERALAS